jgi:Fe-S cluster assembly protein SufD
MEDMVSQKASWVLNNFEAAGKSFSVVSPKSKLEYFQELRSQAFAHFKQQGFPLPGDEDYKYTNLAPLLKNTFELSSRESIKKLVAGDLKRFLLPGTDSAVFVNGYFASHLSSFEPQAGVTIVPFSEVYSSPDSDLEKSAFEKFFSKLADTSKHTFAALNTSLFADGLFVHLAKKVNCEKPLQVIFINTEEKAPRISCPRVLVRAEQSSSFCLIERHVSAGNSTDHLSLGTLEFSLADAAEVDHYRLLEEEKGAYHLSELHSVLQRDSRFRTHVFNFGGALVRNNVNITLAGENGAATLNGLSALCASQHVDNHTVIDHAVPHCESHELYKGVYAEKSRGVFNGTIIVRQDAQKTNAIQSNQTMLLSQDASIETKPQLKIWADDVKCTHGATIGQLDDNALFYLRSRGIAAEKAKAILIHAFASDVVKEVRPEALRSTIEESLYAVLKG